jgi:MFS family permease
MRRPRLSDAAQIQGLFVFIGLPIAAFFPFVALYLERYHGLDASKIGLVIAFSAAARMIANPSWGHLADAKWGRLTVLQICLAGSGIAALALNVHWVLAGIVVVAAVHSAFLVGQGPNVDALALTHLGDERMSDYGRMRSWESLAYAAGCFGFGMALERFGLAWEMPIYAACVALVLLWSTTLQRDRPTEQIDHGRLGSLGAVFREAPRFWGFLAAVVLVWIGFNAAWNFLALRIADEGGGAFLIGVGTALGGVVEVGVMRGSSRLQQRVGLRRAYMLGCCVYGIGFLSWGLVSDPRLLSALTMLEGVGFSLLFTTAVVIVGRLVPKALYSTGNAVTSMVAFGIAPILGAGLGGFVYQRLGPRVLYGSACALALSAAVVAWFALNVPGLREPWSESGEELPVASLPDTGPTV